MKKIEKEELIQRIDTLNEDMEILKQGTEVSKIKFCISFNTKSNFFPTTRRFRPQNRTTMHVLNCHENSLITKLRMVLYLVFVNDSLRLLIYDLRFDHLDRKKSNN